MSKTMKTMIGADLDLSNHEFVSWPFKHHLLPEEITIGTNVTYSPASLSELGSPVGSPAECLNLVFVYPSFFTSESIMDGAIEGQVIARLLSQASVSSSYTMYLTNIYITLFKYKAEITITDSDGKTGTQTLEMGSTSMPAIPQDKVTVKLSTDGKTANRTVELPQTHAGLPTGTDWKVNLKLTRGTIVSEHSHDILR